MVKKFPYLHKTWFYIFIFIFLLQHIVSINIICLNSLICWQVFSKGYLNVKFNMIYHNINVILKELYLFVSKQHLSGFVFIWLTKAGRKAGIKTLKWGQMCNKLQATKTEKTLKKHPWHNPKICWFYFFLRIKHFRMETHAPILREFTFPQIISQSKYIFEK